MNLRRLSGQLRDWMKNLIGVTDSSEALARGAAVGFFFGMSFFWGLQILLAVAGAHLLRGNKVVAGSMTAISNPATSLPLYTACYFVGEQLLGRSGRLPELSRLESLGAVLALGPEFLASMLLGTTVVGLVGAVAVYFLSDRLFAWLRRRFHHVESPHSAVDSDGAS